MIKIKKNFTFSSHIASLVINNNLPTISVVDIPSVRLMILIRKIFKENQILHSSSIFEWLICILSIWSLDKIISMSYMRAILQVYYFNRGVISILHNYFICPLTCLHKCIPLLISHYWGSFGFSNGWWSNYTYHQYIT